MRSTNSHPALDYWNCVSFYRFQNFIHLFDNQKNRKARLLVDEHFWNLCRLRVFDMENENRMKEKLSNFCCSNEIRDIEDWNNWTRAEENPNFHHLFSCSLLPFFLVRLFDFSWDLDVSQTNMISCCSLLMWRKWRTRRRWFDLIPMVAMVDVNPISMEIRSLCKPLFVRLLGKLQVVVRCERFIQIIVGWQIMFCE